MYVFKDGVRREMRREKVIQNGEYGKKKRIILIEEVLYLGYFWEFDIVRKMMEVKFFIFEVRLNRFQFEIICDFDSGDIFSVFGF